MASVTLPDAAVQPLIEDNGEIAVTSSQNDNASLLPRSGRLPAALLLLVAVVGVAANLVPKVLGHEAGAHRGGVMLSLGGLKHIVSEVEITADQTLTVTSEATVFTNAQSWTPVGVMLKPGERVVAAGPTEKHVGITLVPIKAIIDSSGNVRTQAGAVQMRVLTLDAPQSMAPMPPPVLTTAAPVTTTPTGWFDCDNGFALWQRGWSQAKKRWCCNRVGRGCSTAPVGTGSVTFTCTPGRDSWQLAWSQEKKVSCCVAKGVGCETHASAGSHQSSHSTSHGPSHQTGHWGASVEFDCGAGYANDMWILGWSIEKMKYCCQVAGKGCAMPVTTTTLQTWAVTTLTTTSPKLYTTLTRTSTVSTTTKEQDAFDCAAGHSKWERGWSVWKKRWCCTNKKVGCPNKDEVSGTCIIRNMNRNGLNQHPQHEKMLFYAVKDAIAKLASGENDPGQMRFAQKRRLLETTSVDAGKDVWVDNWDDPETTDGEAVRFTITVPSGVPIYLVHERVTSDTLPTAIASVVNKLEYLPMIATGGVAVTDCEMDMHVQTMDCICDNGQPATGDVCPLEGAHICASCNLGYSLSNSATPTCVANSCHCMNGVAAIGASCEKSGDEACGYCSAGFHLVQGTYSSAWACQPNVCSCPDGVAATKEACTEHGTLTCASCDAGFHVDSRTLECEPNVCHCRDGTAAEEGTVGCAEHETEACAICDFGFHLSPFTKKCEVNECICPSGTAAVGTMCAKHGDTKCTNCYDNAFLRKDGTCGSKKCWCSNGVAVSGDNCTTNHGQMCESCNEGYTLWEKYGQCVLDSCTCTGGLPVSECPSDNSEMCQSCDRGYFLRGHLCVENLCTCTGGTPAAGEVCMLDGLEVCATCNPGFHARTGIHEESGRTTVSCVPNECTCEHGVAATAGTNKTCLINGAETCESCNLDSTYTSGGKVCVRRKCSCPNGEGTTGDHCAVHGQPDCASCHEGFRLTSLGVASVNTQRCETEHRGRAIFNCEAGVEKRAVGWSDLKRSWCCTHEGVGCDDGELSGTEACRIDFSESQCGRVGCCTYTAGVGCQSSVGDGSCLPSKLIMLSGSKGNYPRGLCLAATVSNGVILEECNSHDAGQKWTFDEGDLMIAAAGQCMAASEPKFSGVLLTVNPCNGEHVNLDWSQDAPTRFKLGSLCLSTRNGTPQPGSKVSLQDCGESAPGTPYLQDWAIPDGVLKEPSPVLRRK